MHIHKILTLVFLIASFGSITHPASAKDVALQPVGEYAEIDTHRENLVILMLQEGGEDRKKAMRMILSQPERYAPPVLMALSYFLFQDGRKDEAAFWFYAGQLRARFDANRCADVTARQAVSILNNQFGPPINQYMFQDANIPKLEALVPRVVAWDRKTPHKYDHRWINLHGRNAMSASLASQKGKPAEAKPLSMPQAQWPRIAEKTRNDYLEGFREVMEERRALKAKEKARR